MTNRSGGITVNATLTVTPRSARTEADEFGSFVRRILRAYGRRVADRDIEALAGLVSLRNEIDGQIEAAAGSLHDTYSWTEIGRVLGITRQAAQQRFSRPAETVTTD